MEVLRYGDRGDLVREVQARLRELGYKAETTGVMDNQTMRALINYQRASGIFPNSGQIDEQTLRALKLR